MLQRQNYGIFRHIRKETYTDGQQVAQKTKDTAEVIKYNSMISDEDAALTSFMYKSAKRM